MALPIYHTQELGNNQQKNVIDADITQAKPYKTGFIQASADVTVDIEDGVTVTIDEGCALIITDSPDDAMTWLPLGVA